MLKAWIEQECATTIEARKLKKLRLTMECQVEKVKAATNSKARWGERKVHSLYYLLLYLG